MTALAPTLQAFFTDRLIRQRHASSHTIAAYRDTLRLLLTYVADQAGVPPSRLDIGELDAPMIGAFLDHLEHERGNSVRTRNARLAAVHSLFRFAALSHPEHAGSISRVLAIPPKRCDQALVTYLTDEEVDALLGAPDLGTWTGRRDHALLQLDIQTGLRISELSGLTIADVHLDTGAHVSCRGKGCKERITPLTTETVTTLRAWLAEHDTLPGAPLFPGRTGRRLSRDAVEHRIAKHTETAALGCPSLATKRVTAHVLRHTTAMRLLHAGVDTAVSRSGSVTRASRRHRSTCSPTSISKNERSPARDESAVHHADTARPTASSPGSNGSDYADLASTKPLHRKGSRDHVGKPGGRHNGSYADVGITCTTQRISCPCAPRVPGPG